MATYGKITGGSPAGHVLLRGGMIAREKFPAGLRERSSAALKGCSQFHPRYMQSRDI
jgi:hypothetical protein